MPAVSVLLPYNAIYHCLLLAVHVSFGFRLEPLNPPPPPPRPNTLPLRMCKYLLELGKEDREGCKKGS